MLIRLRICDFAIIEQVELELGPGLNVLTGETGAGKSIIVGAAALLRGGRASADLIRDGAERAVIEAIFDISAHPDATARLDEAGVDLEPDGELLVRRILARSGRSKVTLNGSLCTLGQMTSITSKLLDISGQHEHQALSDPAAQLEILDEYGRLAALRRQMLAAFSDLSSSADHLSRFQADERQRSERREFLRFQLTELATVRLSPGEEEALAQTIATLRRASELQATARECEQTIYAADGAASERLAAAARKLGHLAAVDRAFEELAGQLEEAQHLVEDVASRLAAHAESVELDPQRLAEAEDRMDTLQRLKRKHGGSVEEIIARQRAMRDELAELEDYDATVQARRAALDAARERAAALAEVLSSKRSKAARSLKKRAERHLRALCMEDARLEVALERRSVREGDADALVFGDRRIGPKGWDRAEFLIAADAGATPRGLGKVASGGELSRVMLALRQVIGEYDPLSTSIYDEVDAGIGGQTADVVGASLARVAKHRQVLCVTHLPQVAAHADQHFHVGKARRQAGPRTAVESLDEKGRVEELARMLGARRISAQARENARELLRAARATG